MALTPPTERRWHDLGLELDDVSTEVDIGPPGADALGRLIQMVEEHRPAWQRDALCREYRHLHWFPERGDRVDELRAVCERCPVAAECRAFAIETGANAGCWAGVVGRGLRRLREAA